MLPLLAFASYFDHRYRPIHHSQERGEEVAWLAALVPQYAVEPEETAYPASRGLRSDVLSQAEAFAEL